MMFEPLLLDDCVSEGVTAEVLCNIRTVLSVLDAISLALQTLSTH